MGDTSLGRYNANPRIRVQKAEVRSRMGHLPHLQAPGRAARSRRGHLDADPLLAHPWQNVTLALRFIKERGVHLTNIAAEGAARTFRSTAAQSWACADEYLAFASQTSSTATSSSSSAWCVL